MALSLCHSFFKVRISETVVCSGEKNSLCELTSPRFGPHFSVNSKWPWTPHFLESVLKLRKFFSLLEAATTKVTELLPALMSFFIIKNSVRAEMGVEHPCAIFESQLIMLFYKMIIAGLFGFFFFSDEANSWASITSLWALVIDHINSTIQAALWSFAEGAEHYFFYEDTVASDPHSLELHATPNWQAWY